MSNDMNHMTIHRFSFIKDLGDLRAAMEKVANWPPGYQVRVHNDQIEIIYDSDEFKARHD